jgi:uncharacterized membrane protein YfcA
MTVLSQIIIIALFAFAGTLFQTVTGFGVSFFLPPILLLYFSPSTAITVGLLVADVICLLVLFAERRSREFSWPIVRMLIIAALPGLVIGALIVTQIHKEVLQIVIGLLIIIGVTIQEYVFPKPSRPPRLSGLSVATGFTAGLMNSSAALAAPPLVLWLRSCIVTPNQMRDTLSVTFLGMNTLSVLVIYFLKPMSLTSHGMLIFLFLLPVVLVAHRFGKRLVARIDPLHYRRLILIALSLAGVANILLGIAKLR